MSDQPDPMTPAGRPAGDEADREARPVVQRTEAQWRALLSPQEFHVLREAGTERPFTGEYWDTETEGVYTCRACGEELFRSETKFGSHCGWPSFFAPLAQDRVRCVRDSTLGMERVEVRCSACDSHLGHVFAGEGYPTPTDLRYCINSLSLRLEPSDAPSTPRDPGEAAGD